MISTTQKTMRPRDGRGAPGAHRQLWEEPCALLPSPRGWQTFQKAEGLEPPERAQLAFKHPKKALVASQYP